MTNGNAQDRIRPPAPLLVAASLVAVEGGLLVVYAVLEIFSVGSGRVTMGVTTALFFALYGAGLLACAWALSRRGSWARSPIVLAQLIQLGLAWNFRGGDTTLAAVVIALVSVVVLAGIFHPASLEALADPNSD
ncbi:hypothetical protein ABLE68_01310 [Nocardioides sp. CN2-186]|uniref:hypothetical protein n=1 Tax=Nocardioides tweenelious TaxID=3156607 RepID=UPI0032B4FB0F